ncbi:hypothetical protein PMAYCL1PPCAC_09439, partial [Pristionchus mayeri]
TYASVVRALADSDKIRSKSQRAVLVGSTEKSTPQETAAHDESTLKNIINVTNDSELKEAYDKGQITHHRFPENKPPVLRDRLLTGIRSVARPSFFEPSMFVRRDLMPSELEQERNARDEARKRNIEANCLKWGVRDCELIQFRGPNFRPLPSHYRNTQDKKTLLNCAPPNGSKSSQNLSLLFANCRSVRNVIDTITLLLLHRNLDILALTETWLSDADSDALLLRGLSDYFIFRSDRVDSRGGGVLIYAHSKLLPIFVSSLIIPGYECITIDIYSNSPSIHANSLRIITVYRAPNSPLSSNLPFLDYLNLATSCQHPSLIIGSNSKPSRNYHLANWDMINNHIAMHNWTIALSNMTATEAYKYFSEFLNSILDAYVPLKTVKTSSGYPKHLSKLHDRLQQLHERAPNSDATHSLRVRFNKALKSFEIKLPKINGSPDNIPNLVFTNNLHFGHHIAQITRKARSMCNLLLRSFLTTSADILLKAYKIYIRPLLESSTIIWNPIAIGLVNQIESVQREFTRRVLGRSKLPYLTYPDRLKHFQIETLEYRRSLNDIYFLYDSLHDYVLLDTSSLYSIAPLTRSLRASHSLRIALPFVSPSSITSCATRSLTLWNSLPNQIVTMPRIPFRRLMKNSPMNVLHSSNIRM